jgi:multiple sugar transport system permease protein
MTTISLKNESRSRAADGAGGLPGKRRPSGARKPRRIAYLFIAPFVLVFIAMLVVPIFYALYLSLFKSQLIGGLTFAGLDNYVRAFTDPKLIEGLGRVGLFLVIQVPIMLALSLFFALAIDGARFRGAKITRLLIFIPYAIPGVVGVLIWGYLYGTNFGLITQIIRAVGIAPPNLLSADNMLGSMMNIVIWQYAGYNMIVLFSALRAIPTELFESAIVDGAGQWRIAWSIKIPAIRPAILLCVIFSAIGAFQLFTEPNLLQPLAPTVVNHWYTPSYYAYNTAFVDHDSSYAATLAFALGLVIAVVSYIVQLITQRRNAS